MEASYLLQNYRSHHIHSDFNFCDKFFTYGASKYLNGKKFVVTGCLRDPFYKNNLKNKVPLKMIMNLCMCPIQL